MIFGTGALKFYHPYTNITFEPSIADYEMKAEYNIEDIVYMKAVNGKKTILDKKYYHTFTINFHNISTVNSDKLKAMILSSGNPFRFYPHVDSVKYYNGVMTKFKPTYNNNQFTSGSDELIVVVKTISSERIEPAGQHVIHEAWDWDIFDTSYGLNGSTYTGVGTYNIVTGKIGDGIKLPSGANYFGYVNGAWLIETGNHTINFWFKFDATAGYGDLMAAGTSGLAAQAYRLTKNPSNGNGTVNLSLTIEGVTRASDVVLTENAWHMATITVSGGDVWIHIDNVLEFQAGYSTAHTHLYMGQGIGATKTFDAYFDELVIVLGIDLTYAGVNYWWNGGAGRTFTNPNFWY